MGLRLGSPYGRDRGGVRFYRSIEVPRIPFSGEHSAFKLAWRKLWAGGFLCCLRLSGTVHILRSPDISQRRHQHFERTACPNRHGVPAGERTLVAPRTLRYICDVIDVLDLELRKKGTICPTLRLHSRLDRQVVRLNTIHLVLLARFVQDDDSKPNARYRSNAAFRHLIDSTHTVYVMVHLCMW